MHHKSTWKQGGFFDQQKCTKKVGGNKVDFSTIDNTPKKVRGDEVDFWTIKITSKKVRGNDVEIRQNLAFDVST